MTSGRRRWHGIAHHFVVVAREIVIPGGGIGRAPAIVVDRA